jgi:hypothetical protein
MLGHRVNSEGLRGRANAPRRRRAQEDLYRVRQRFLSTFPSALHKRKRQFLPVSAICGLAFSPPPRALPKGYSRVCPKVCPRVHTRVCTRASPPVCSRRWTIGEFATYPHAAAVFGGIRRHFGRAAQPCLAVLAVPGGTCRTSLLGRTWFTWSYLSHIPRPIFAQSVGCREHGVSDSIT